MEPYQIFILIFVCLSLPLPLSLTIVSYTQIFRGLKAPRDKYSSLKFIEDDLKREEIKKCIDEASALPYRRLSIKSEDDLCLEADYYESRRGAPAHIFVHGYRSHPLRDLPLPVLNAYSRGENILLVYNRSHGVSEGKSITFGDKESRDLKGWVDYLCESEAPSDVILHGLSMGAATVIICSGMALNEKVRCIIADCPYYSAKEEIIHRIKQQKLSPAVVYPTALLASRLFCRFSIKDASPANAITKSSYPILIIHGEDDDFVPTEMSKRLLSLSRSECKLFTVAGATHGASLIINPEGAVAEINSFIDSHLKDNRKD